MRFHLEVLARAQQSALRRLGPLLTPRGFYLAGGTALALHLGHRRSVDLDWFTTAPLEDPLNLAQVLREEGLPFRTDEVAPGTLHGKVLGVRVSLLEYRYALLGPLVPWAAFGCRLAARPDLAAMKLAAVAQRGARKDFVDLYALLVRSISLQELLQWYREKYSVCDIQHVLYSLVYFDEADRERMPRMLWQVTWVQIKARLKALLRGHEGKHPQ